MKLIPIDEKYFQYLPALLAIILYAFTLGHEYVYDDEVVILENQHVQDGISGLDKIWTKNYLHGHNAFNDGLYRPLSPSMFALEIEFFGNNPMIGHLLNVLFYALLCWVVFLFVKNLSGSAFLALFAGLLFAAHPIHTEVVANIKSRDELLAAVFGFVTLYFASKKADIGVKQGLLIGISFLLALFSKESAIAYIALFPIVYFVQFKKFQAKFYALFSVLGVIALSWFFYRQSIIDGMNSAVDEGLFSQLSNSVLLAETKLDQFTTGLWIVMVYLYKSIIPYPLVSDYSPNTILPVSFFSFKGLGSFFSLSAMVIAGLYFTYKKQLEGLAILIFFILLAPVSNVFLPIGTTIGERLAFTPSLGIVLLFVLLLQKWKQGKSQIIFASVTIVFSIMTISRAAEWKNNFTLFEADVKKHQESFRTHYNYGTELNKSVGTKTSEQLTAEDRKNLTASIKHFKKTSEIKPDYADVILNMGNAYRRLGKSKEALKLYGYLMKEKPDYTKAVYNTAVTYYEIEQYQKAHDFFIQYTNTNGSMQGSAWYSAGVCSGYLANFDQAIRELENALAIDDSKWNAWEFLGMAYGNLNQWDKAANAFSRAYAINTDPKIKEKMDRAKINQ